MVDTLKPLKFLKMINLVDVWVSLTGIMGGIKCSSAVVIPPEVRQDSSGNIF